MGGMCTDDLKVGFPFLDPASAPGLPAWISVPSTPRTRRQPARLPADSTPEDAGSSPTGIFVYLKIESVSWRSTGPREEGLAFRTYLKQGSVYR